MARGRRQSGFEVFVEVASKFSWKICLLLAVGSYLVLHAVAGIKAEQPAHIGTMGNFVVKQMIVTFAMFAQLLFPAGFLFGAVVSFF